MSRHNSTRVEERRTERLIVRMTPTEMATIRTQADQSGWSVGRLVRHAVCEQGSPMPDSTTREIAEQIRGLRADLGRLGNNVNQLARVANATGRLPEGTAWERVGRGIDQLREQLENLHGNF